MCRHESAPVVGCKFTYRSSAGRNGTITSPNYPGLYPRKTRCTYVLVLEPQQRVIVTFRRFDVEGIMPELVALIILFYHRNRSNKKLCFILVTFYDVLKVFFISPTFFLN